MNDTLIGAILLGAFILGCVVAMIYVLNQVARKTTEFRELADESNDE